MQNSTLSAKSRMWRLYDHLTKPSYTNQISFYYFYMINRATASLPQEVRGTCKLSYLPICFSMSSILILRYPVRRGELAHVMVFKANSLPLAAISSAILSLAFNTSFRSSVIAPFNSSGVPVKKAIISYKSEKSYRPGI